MHLFLMTRGIQQARDIWKQFMCSQMFDWKRTNLETNKEEFSKVQGALRPIEFWEYVFPQEHLQEVLAMQNQLYNNFPLRPEVNNFAWVLRKMLKAKAIPKDIIEGMKDKEMHQLTTKYIPMAGMGVYPLGIREDITKDYDFGKAGKFHQEGL